MVKLMRRGPRFRSLQKRFRQRRFDLLIRLIRDMSASGDRFRILDTGGRPRYWEMLPSDLRPKVNISILNLGNEVSNFIDPSNDLRVDYEVGDACDLPHEDNAFDLVHSNSVIEHVGSYERMQRFA
jgi:hypothetical protein